MRTIISLLCISLIFWFVACSKHSEEPPSSPFIGKWLLVRSTVKQYRNGSLTTDLDQKYPPIVDYLIFENNTRLRIGHVLNWTIPGEELFDYQINNNELIYGKSSLKILQITGSQLVLFYSSVDGAPAETHFTFYYIRIPDCPCSYAEVKNLGKTTNPTGEWKNCNDASQSFHYGSTTEARWSPANSGDPGQQCTYDKAGNLITGGLAAGSMDRVSPRQCGTRDEVDKWFVNNACSLFDHCVQDVQPWMANNAYTIPCAQYMYLWPANRGKNCKPNIINSFDHMKKLVGDMSCEEVTLLLKEVNESPNSAIDRDLKKYITGEQTNLTTDQIITKLQIWQITLGPKEKNISSIIDKSIANLRK